MASNLMASKVTVYMVMAYIPTLVLPLNIYGLYGYSAHMALYRHRPSMALVEQEHSYDLHSYSLGMAHLWLELNRNIVMTYIAMA